MSEKCDLNEMPRGKGLGQILTRNADVFYCPCPSKHRLSLFSPLFPPSPRCQSDRRDFSFAFNCLVCSISACSRARSTASWMTGADGGRQGGGAGGGEGVGSDFDAARRAA